MAQQVIKANEFRNRSDIERYVFAEIGSDINKNLNSDIIIRGKKEELKQLFLSDMSRVYGLRCVITDNPTKDRVKIKRVANKKRIAKNVQ